ncbi:MAG: histidine kinase dimerization/phospho-acceptor domain-containing protein [Rhodothalassiaceae bacterium]
MPRMRGDADTRFEPLEFPALRSGLASCGLFDAVFEECEAGIIILDLDLDRMLLSVSDVNPTLLAWLGRTRPNLVGRNFLTLLDARRAPDEVRRLGQAIARQEGVRVQLALRAAGGEAVPGNLSLRPIGRDPRHPRMVAIFRREAESLHQALIAAQRERDAAREARQRILARMSHELRTPLNGILGFAELMGSMPAEQADIGRYRGYALDISAAGRELLMRVEDLLAVAEAGRGEAQPASESVDLATLIERAVGAAEVNAERQGQRIVLRSGSCLPRLAADVREMTRLGDAVIDFALRGAPRGSVIDVALDRASDGGLVLRVDDDGAVLTLADVESAVLAHDDGRDVMVSDTGRSCAGLPMVKAIVERLGGNFSIGATDDGQRSRCAIHFPADRLSLSNQPSRPGGRGMPRAPSWP